MDNEQLLDRVHNLLLGMEERANTRFDAMDQRFDAMDSRLDLLETKVDSISRELKLNNELLAPFIKCSHQVEDEAKLENPAA